MTPERRQMRHAVCHAECVQNFLAIVQTLGSVVLVGVTAWYAILTRGMARAAAESAASSEKAAEAAVKALTISAASVDVDFEISPAYFLADQEQLGLTLRSAGATVWVHRARLHSAHRSTAHVKGYGENFSQIVGDRELTCESTNLPARLHRGEDLSFVISPDFALPNPDWGVASMEATVWYSLDGVAPGIERRVSYHGVVGKDYPDPGPQGMIDFPDHGLERD